MSRKTLKPSTAPKRDPRVATTEVTLQRKTPSDRLRTAAPPVVDTALCVRVLALLKDGNVAIGVQPHTATRNWFVATTTLRRGARDRVVHGSGSSNLAAVQAVLDQLDG